MHIIDPETDFRNMDETRLSYYRSYLLDYYNDEFRKNQGTEDILAMLSMHGRGGNWLDVGAGPATLFWAMALEKIRTLDCTEICVEGIKVLHDFVLSGAIPRCYQEASDLLGLSKGRLEQPRKLPIRYMIFDAMAPWPAQLSEQYDLITAFGVYGLSPSESAYMQNFHYMKPALRPDGRALGANWVRSTSMIERVGGDNRYLRPDLIKQAALLYGYKILHLSEVTIINDPNYDRIILWALKQ